MTIEEMIMNATDEELDVYVKSDDSYVRAKVAEQRRDEDLDILVHDEDWYVRATVAEQKRDKDLDILVHDEDWLVRTISKGIRENLKNKEE